VTCEPGAVAGATDLLAAGGGGGPAGRMNATFMRWHVARGPWPVAGGRWPAPGGRGHRCARSAIASLAQVARNLAAAAKPELRLLLAAPRAEPASPRREITLPLAEIAVRLREDAEVEAGLARRQPVGLVLAGDRACVALPYGDAGAIVCAHRAAASSGRAYVTSVYEAEVIIGTPRVADGELSDMAWFSPGDQPGTHASRIVLPAHLG